MKHLPFFKIKGSYKQIGEYLGTTFKEKIQNSIDNRRKTIPGYQDYLPKSQKCLEVTQKYFPNLIDESMAIANAAGVPFIEFFFMNNREVYDEAESWDLQSAVNPDHCTVVAGFDNSKLVIGHNEDWTVEVIDEFGILEATVGDTTFIGMHYMNVIPGLSASMNSHGLVQCINDIYQTNQIGVPKNYIARAILEAKTLDEAETIIRNTPKASGFNHVLAQGNEIRNIEIAGDTIGIQRILNKPYVHTNHYLSKELKSLEKFHTKSSEARFERATELLKDNMDAQDLKNILRDKTNPEFPICREDETIGSAVFTPSQYKAEFCYGHPCSGEYVEYIISDKD